jgi:hypothetical protein
VRIAPSKFGTRAPDTTILEVVLQGLHKFRYPVRHSERAASGWHHCLDRLRQLDREGDVLRHHRCDKEVWPAADRIAVWMHETALHLFPDSPYAKAHGGAAERLDLARSNGTLVCSQAAAEDGRTNPIFANHFVVVTSVGHSDNFIVDDANEGMTVRAAAARAEAAANNREGDLHASGALVLDFVGIKFRPRIELLGSCRNAGAGLQSLSVNPDDKLAALLRDLISWRAGTN